MSVEPVQIGLLLFAGFLYWGHREYRTGWGGKYREIRERQGLLYMLFAARAGRVMLPGAWGMSGLFIFAVLASLHRENDSEALRVIAIVIAIPSLALVAYGLKLFFKPRRDAKVPDWVRELEEPIS